MPTLGLIVLVPPLERGIFNLLKRRLGTEQVGLPMALLVRLAAATAPDGRLHLACLDVGQNSNHQDKAQIALTNESLACRQYTHAVLGRS